MSLRRHCSTRYGRGQNLHEYLSGYSDLCYNDMSELAQMVRRSNHKTLVKNRGDDASTAAGGLIVMHEETTSAEEESVFAAGGCGGAAGVVAGD